MGSCLALVLANIILTEFEKVIVDDLINTGIIAFYCSYVDDTLVLIKPKDIPFVLNKFNSFDKNLKFTVDNFENGKIHFLDLEISDSSIDIFRKSTHTGQYTRFDSFGPWSRKTAWARLPFHRALNICSNLTFINKQISMISKFMSWNGFPANVRFSIIRKLKAKYEVNSNTYCSKHNTNELPPQNDFSDDPRPKTWIRIPFLGKQGEFLVKKLLRKIQRNVTQLVKFVVIYDTKKISYFLPKKDKIPNTSCSNLVYEFTCPGCNSSYTGKTRGGSTAVT